MHEVILAKICCYIFFVCSAFYILYVYVYMYVCIYECIHAFICIPMCGGQR